MTGSISDVSFAFPTLNSIISVLTLQAGYNSVVVVIGSTFLGISAGIIGTFALLRKRAMMGDALAHAALPGLAVAFLLSVTFSFIEKTLPTLLTGATISGVLGVLAVQFLVRHTRLTEDTAIGAVLSIFFGTGVVLMSAIQYLETGGEGGLHHFIYGQTAAMNQTDAIVTALVALLTGLSAVIFLKEFRLVCFDSHFAQVQGWPVSLLDLLMMSLVVVVTVIGLQSVGLILIVALLIVPPCTARFWTERLNVMVAVSAVFGGLSCYVGASASALAPRLPAGAVIVLSSGVFFFISFFFAPKRGIIATSLRIAKQRLLISRDHLLRRMYEFLELNEKHINDHQHIDIDWLPICRAWPFVFRWLVLSWISWQGLITLNKRSIAFTESGATKAFDLTMNHRLWEEYLVTYAHLSSSHVDWSADIVEHVLSSDLVNKLKAALLAKGRLPEDKFSLPSIHPLSDLTEQQMSYNSSYNSSDKKR